MAVSGGSRLPATDEQLQFLIPPHERRQFGLRHRFKAAASRTRMQHLGEGEGSASGEIKTLLFAQSESALDDSERLRPDEHLIWTGSLTDGSRDLEALASDQPEFG